VPELFIGESTHKVDDKGRVSIPALFRKVLADGDPAGDSQRPRVLISYGDPRKQYLECYTYTAFQEVAGGILSMPRGSPHRAMLEEMVIGQTLPTEIDPDGRLVLPQKLRDKAGIELKGNALFLSAGNTFQIWAPDTHAEVRRRRYDKWLAEQPEDFDPLILIDEFRQSRSGA